MSDSLRIRVAGIMKVGNKVLFVRHRKNVQTYWLLPGGGLETGESSVDCLQREFKEELDLDIEVGSLLFCCDVVGGYRHIFQVVFEVFCQSIRPILGEDPILDGYDFFTPREIEKIVLYPDTRNEILSFINKTDQNSRRYIALNWQ